jgi:hypothetical protein
MLLLREVKLVVHAFKCGLPCHMARNRPNRQQNQRASQQQRMQGQQNFAYGKINHVTVEEAQQS